MTTNQTVVTDEQLDQELNELSQKAERTDEENKKLNELETEKKSRYQKRIDTLTFRAKSAEEGKAELEEKIKALEEKIEQIGKPATPTIATKQTVTIGSQSYYTDDTLIAMIQNNEISEADAYKHQRARDKAEMKEELKEEFKGTTQKQQAQREMEADAQKILKEYPHFSNKHPNFNPEDPLYKEATRIYQAGLNTNPRGLSMAVELAKKTLGMDRGNPDISDDLNISLNRSAPLPAKKKEVPLTESEKEIAIRMYCRGDVINPKTGKAYTEAEAIEKAKAANTARTGE